MVPDAVMDILAVREGDIVELKETERDTEELRVIEGDAE